MVKLRAAKLRRRVGSALALALGSLLGVPAWANGQDDPDPVAAAQTARDALARLDQGWIPYDDQPSLDDPRWKVQMEALVQVVRAGPAAASVLQAAAKEDASWSDSTRTFAAKVLEIVEGAAAVRNAVAEYDLAEMDTARAGVQAPGFALTDASGETYRLGSFRGKKVVVLTFVVADT